jgi:hypothetical protein
MEPPYPLSASLSVIGELSGSGTATIDGAGTLDLESSATSNVVFGGHRWNAEAWRLFSLQW